MTIAPVTRSTRDPEPGALYPIRVRAYRLFYPGLPFTPCSVQRLGLVGSIRDRPPQPANFAAGYLIGCNDRAN